MTFYNYSGEAIAYLDDDSTHIYLFDGTPAAYLVKNMVYGFNGHQFGWFEKGWIRDLNGNCVFFTENAPGSGPVKPIKQISPVKSIKHIKPIKCIREISRVKAINSLSWSSFSDRQFFDQ